MLILVFSVFAYLGPLGRLHRTRLQKTLLEEYLDEMSENHLENMYYVYFFTDFSS